jgi:hypothetical protein
MNITSKHQIIINVLLNAAFDICSLSLSRTYPGKALYTLIGDTGSGYAKLGFLFLTMISLACYVGWRSWFQSKVGSSSSF